MRSKLFFFFITGMIWCTACSNKDETTPPNEAIPPTPEIETTTISAVTFIDEFVIPDQNINGIPFGGISGIEYVNATWYLLSDTSTPPIRYYTADISYTDSEFTSVAVNSMVEIKNAEGNSLAIGTVDPEGIRFNAAKNVLVYTSEGPVSVGIAPSLYEISISGVQQQQYSLPNYFNAPSTENPVFGSRHNGTAEGLSLSFDQTGYWISMELPLLQDGPAPTTTDTESPIRISLLNANTGMAERQFVYELDPIARPIAFGDITINGVVELLEYDTNQFLVLERSFSSGYLDGGSTLKLYKVDASVATNTLTMDTLPSEGYTKATKTLLFNFDTVRSELTNGIVGNLEGMTFGPKLPDGSRTLVLIADNNFNAVIPQLSQLIAMKITP